MSKAPFKKRTKRNILGFLLSWALQSGELVNVGLVWPCHSVSVNKEHASIGSQGGLHLKLKLRTELAFPWQGSIFWIKTRWPKCLRSWEASVHFNPLPEQGVSSESELQRRSGARGLQGSRFQATVPNTVTFADRNQLCKEEEWKCCTNFPEQAASEKV